MDRAVTKVSYFSETLLLTLSDYYTRFEKICSRQHVRIKWVNTRISFKMVEWM